VARERMISLVLTLQKGVMGSGGFLAFNFQRMTIVGSGFIAFLFTNWLMKRGAW